MKKDVNILLWVFFVSKGMKDNTDLIRAQLLIMECMKEGATVESVKQSTGYLSCINDLPDEMLTDSYINDIISW